jgi:phosphoserine phosphatase
MNLVVLATQAISAPQLQRIAGLATTDKIEQIAPHTYQMRDAKPNDGIAMYCMEQQIDYAFVREGHTLGNFGLLVMDMDSTLINIECIDEIADMQGIKPAVSAITESAMRGEIDFAESLRRRVALLKGLSEDALLRVYQERLQLNPGAELMLAGLKQHGIKTLLVSGGFTFFTERLKARLGLDYAHANTLEIINGKLTGEILGDILDAQAKADWLVNIRDELGLGAGQVIAMGDGANDLKMMSAAAVGIAYHAKPIVRSQATYALNFVGLNGLLALLQ